nr:hypothetical protein [Tanacetum cinerariifolium]
MDHSNPTFAKIPILDNEKFEQWKFIFQQYLQNKHYALWEVIKFGDSYKAPPEETGKGPASKSSAKKKGRTVAITTEDMQKRRNDVKARTTLLLALPDEHQLRFSKADRFWKKTGKKITIQGSDVAGFDKLKVECFNCHKMGHFSRECREPRSQDRGKRESYKQGPKEEEPAPKALMAIDGIGWDWSYMSNEEENHTLLADDEVPKEFALMAKSSSSSDNEVYDDSYCSKSCRKNTENLNTKISKLNEELSDCETDLYNYKRGLPEFVDDTVTDYRRPTPNIDASICNKVSLIAVLNLFKVTITLQAKVVDPSLGINK